MWVTASMNTSSDAEKSTKETAIVDIDTDDNVEPAGVVESNYEAEDASENADTSADALKSTADEETSHIINKENSDIINGAVVKAEQEHIENIANNTHTGISVEGDCHACAYQYELNEQTQADFAGRDLEADVEATEQQVEGGPLDQLSCIVM